jgi:hypothetical protein
LRDNNIKKLLEDVEMLQGIIERSATITNKMYADNCDEINAIDKNFTKDLEKHIKEMDHKAIKEKLNNFLDNQPKKEK